MRRVLYGETCVVPHSCIHAQKTAALVFPQASVQAALFDELGVRAFFHNASLVQHDEAVHGGDGREAVCNGDNGFAFHELVQAFLNGSFDLAVEGAGDSDDLFFC